MTFLREMNEEIARQKKMEITFTDEAEIGEYINNNYNYNYNYFN